MTTPFSTGVTKLSKQIERILFFFFLSLRVSFRSFFSSKRREKREREGERVKYCLEYRGNFFHRLSVREETNCCRLISYSNRFVNRTIENCLKIVGKFFDSEKRKKKKNVVGRGIFWKKGRAMLDA